MSKSTDELVEKITKPKKKTSKEGGNMKKFIKNNWKVVLAVLVTLGVVLGSYKIFYMGVNYEASKQRVLNERVEAAKSEVVSRVESKN